MGKQQRTLTITLGRELTQALEAEKTRLGELGHDVTSSSIIRRALEEYLARRDNACGSKPGNHTAA
jgi:hypothetical protein